MGSRFSKCTVFFNRVSQPESITSDEEDNVVFFRCPCFDVPIFWFLFFECFSFNVSVFSMCFLASVLVSYLSDVILGNCFEDWTLETRRKFATILAEFMFLMIDYNFTYSKRKLFFRDFSCFSVEIKTLNRKGIQVDLMFRKTRHVQQTLNHVFYENIWGQVGGGRRAEGEKTK